MSTKTTSASTQHTKLPDISKMNSEQLEAHMASLRAAIKDRKDQESAAQDTKNKAITATFESLPKSLSLITGAPVTLAEAVTMFVRFAKGGAGKLVRSAKGKVGKLVKTSTSDGDKGKRLSDQTRAAIHADMMKWEIARKFGKPTDTISVIARRHKVTEQTVDKYRPKKVEIKAAIENLVIQAPVLTPAAPAVEPSAQPAAPVAVTA